MLSSSRKTQEFLISCLAFAGQPRMILIVRSDLVLKGHTLMVGSHASTVGGGGPAEAATILQKDANIGRYQIDNLARHPFNPPNGPFMLAAGGRKSPAKGRSKKPTQELVPCLEERIKETKRPAFPGEISDETTGCVGRPPVLAASAAPGDESNRRRES
jgi:hypothetical protein